MLQGWEKTQPGRVGSIFGALKNIAPSQLADVSLFNFSGLTLDRSGERPLPLFEREADEIVSSGNVVQFIEAKNL